MKRMLKRLALGLSDRLRYSPLVRRILARFKQLCGTPSKGGDDQAIARSLVKLCGIARLNGEELAPGKVLEQIRERAGQLSLGGLDLKEFVPEVQRRAIVKAVILKPWIGERERGVLFISFEYEWAKLLVHSRLEELSKQYTLVLAPSASPYNLVNCVFPRAFPCTLFTLISHPEDAVVFERLSPKNRVIPLYASHWVNPEDLLPRPREDRDIDILVVASFGKVKRHHVLFHALRSMPSNLNVVLIGQNQEGRTAESVVAEARLYGVEDRFTVHTSFTHREVATALCRAKISLLLSLREGSSVVVAESLFADTPVGLFENAYVGSRSFINAATGRLLRHRDLAGQLGDFISRYREYSPRRWAEDNISCQASSRVLNDLLKRAALERGEEWTCDIATLCWRPDPHLAYPERNPWLGPEWERVRAHLGVEIGPPPAQTPASPGHPALVGSGRF